MLHRNFAHGKKNSLLLLSCRTSGNCYAQCHFCLWMWDIHVMSAPAQPEESLIMHVYDLNFCTDNLLLWLVRLVGTCLFVWPWPATGKLLFVQSREELLQRRSWEDIHSLCKLLQAKGVEGRKETCWQGKGYISALWQEMKLWLCYHMSLWPSKHTRG